MILQSDETNTGNANDDYHIDIVHSTQAIDKTLRQLESIVSLDSHGVRRLVVENDHRWMIEDVKELERILTCYLLNTVQFQRIHDGLCLETLGRTRRLELSCTPLRSFIPAMLTSHHLKELSVASTLSVEEMHLFADFLSTSTTHALESLDLTGSRFLDDAVSSLADGLRRHGGSLKNIILSECNLVDEQLSSLIDALVDCCSQKNNPNNFSLEELDISFNKSRHLCISSLSVLLQTTRLCTLRMGFQAFGEGKQVDLNAIFQAIVNNQYLTELEIGGNSLRDSDLISLVNALVENDSIQVLDISGNRFTNKGIALLANNLGRIQRLRHLLLEDIRDIDDQCVVILANSFVSSGNNNTLHSIEMGKDLERSDAWRVLAHFLDMNWSGSRRLLELHSQSQGSNNCMALPLSIWPLVLARVNFSERYGMTVRTLNSPNVLYHIMREGLLSLIQQQF